MSSSENELIHDARQVDLDEVIMQNEEQFVMVRLPLSAAQRETVVAEMMFAGTPVADAFEKAILAIGTPIPPREDVKTVGWGRETSFVDIKAPGCHAVSIHKEWEGGIPLVRRTDMEAQVAYLKMILWPILHKLDHVAHKLEQTEDAKSIHQLAHICLSLLSNEEAVRESALDEWEAHKEGSAA
ncbi:hypothetical protein IFJ82_09900 [Novacetimonas hansenii]|uniref:hypothetical protein n=1 Tax=Novacetimonas hansenii TaxID=436 RepID=UPI00177AB22E|nr:hypothetical protein [Novacetimonas hansenii]QOF94264.1 hypothetical protein IFJ82_09900 [Novacetimonas hansenii]